MQNPRWRCRSFPITVSASSSRIIIAASLGTLRFQNPMSLAAVDISRSGCVYIGTHNRVLWKILFPLTISASSTIDLPHTIPISLSLRSRPLLLSSLLARVKSRCPCSLPPSHKQVPPLRPSFGPDQSPRRMRARADASLFLLSPRAPLHSWRSLVRSSEACYEAADFLSPRHLRRPRTLSGRSYRYALGGCVPARAHSRRLATLVYVYYTASARYCIGARGLRIYSAARGLVIIRERVLIYTHIRERRVVRGRSVLFILCGSLIS